VHAVGLKKWELLHGFSYDFLTLQNGQWFIYLILQTLYRAAFILIAYPTFENANSARAGVLYLLPKLLDINPFI
jgi:hypothetical protein